MVKFEFENTNDKNEFEILLHNIYLLQNSR